MQVKVHQVVALSGRTRNRRAGVRFLGALALALMIPGLARADVNLPLHFSDHMVL